MSILSDVLGQKKVSAPNYAGLKPAVEEGAEREKALWSGLTPELSKKTDAFQTGRTALSSALTGKVGGMGTAFEEKMGKLGADQATNLSNTLRQNVLSAQPEVNRQIREGAAASGGLARGSTNAAFAKAGQEALSKIAEGESAIQNQRLQGMQDAAIKVFGANLDAVSQATGLDADTLVDVLNSDRQDIIRQVQGLVDAERTRTSNLLGIDQAQFTSKLAADSANAAGSNALLQALLGAGGTAAGLAAAGSDFGRK